MEIERPQALRANFAYNLLDGGFFGLALGFASYTTILPLFVSSLTNSALLIGLIPAFQNIGWQFPQLLLAQHVSRQKRYKPLVMLITANERIPYFALAGIAWFLPGMNPKAALVLTFLAIIWQSFGAGFIANPWLTMIGKIFPGNIVGTFLGFQSSALYLLGALGAFAAGLLLQSNTGSTGFFYCFLGAGAASLISWFFLGFTIEREHHIDVDAVQRSSLFANISRIWKENHPFRWFLILRMISQFNTMGFAFYLVYAVRHLGASDFLAGVMTSALFVSQVVANPVLGWLSDHWDRRNTLGLGALAGAVSALVALLAPTSNWLVPPLILAGVANTAFSTISMTLTLQYCKDSDRPTYIGMANTLIAPSSMIAPLLGGAIADMYGYQSTFGMSGVAGLVGCAVIFLVLKKHN